MAFAAEAGYHQHLRIVTCRVNDVEVCNILLPYLGTKVVLHLRTHVDDSDMPPGPSTKLSLTQVPIAKISHRPMYLIFRFLSVLIP